MPVGRRHARGRDNLEFGWGTGRVVSAWGGDGAASLPDSLLRLSHRDGF